MEEYEQKDLPREEVYLEQAPHSKRLTNYLIDMVVFFVVLMIVMMIVAAVKGPAYIEQLKPMLAEPSITFQLIAQLVFGLFMGLLEVIFKGKTPGKMVTGTRAIYKDGTTISAAKALERGLCRAIPFNNFSGLWKPCRPWHDMITGTYVIVEKP